MPRNRQPDISCDDAIEDSTESCEETNTTIGEKCPHVKKGNKLKKLKAALKKNQFKKLECSSCNSGANGNEGKEEGPTPLPWICLNCGEQSCNPDQKNHADAHFKIPHSECHSLAVDSHQWTVWCFDCKSSVTAISGKQLVGTVEFLKKCILQGQQNFVEQKPSQPLGQKALQLAVDKKSNAQNFPPVTGLRNLGNTCFFNAVLQCLAQTPFLIKVLEDLRTKDIKFVLPGGKCKISGENEEEVDLPPIEGAVEKLGNNSITSVLCQTLMDMQSKDSFKGIVPSELLNSIRKKETNCMDGGQHDSHELLRLLLELVRNEDLRRYREIILNELGLQKKSNPESVDKDLKCKVKFYGNQASSRLLGPERVFRGVLACVLQCLECKHSSTRTEPFLDLSLPVMAEKPQLSVMKKKNNSFEESTDVAVTNVNNAPSKHQSKKEKREKKEMQKADRRSRRKKLQRKHDLLSNSESVPNENSLAGEKAGSASSESEESDADVEDNIETENGTMPEVSESGYSSEKASAISSPVLLVNLLIPDSISNGLAENSTSEFHSNGNALRTSSKACEYSDTSPIDVSMADLLQMKATENSVSSENGNALEISPQNSDLTSPEGPTVSPLSSPLRDGSTSPVSMFNNDEEMKNFNVNDHHSRWINERDEKINNDNFLCNSRDNALPNDSNFEWKMKDEATNSNQLPSKNEYSSGAIKKVEATNSLFASVQELTSNLSKLNMNHLHSAPSRYHTKEGECSIQQCLNQFATLELMSGNNKVSCEACTKRENKGKEGKMVCTQSTIQYLLKNVPPVLILHLKRFQAQKSGIRKVAKHVSFPMLLDLTPVCQEHDKKRIYALYGVVEQRGTMSGGHYVAYVKSRLPLEEKDPRWMLLPKLETTESDEAFSERNLEVDEEIASAKIPETTEPPPGRWFCVSDSMVREIDEKTVLQSQAYLLFYERIL